MRAFKSFAKNTIGELRDALLDESDEEQIEHSPHASGRDTTTESRTIPIAPAAFVVPVTPHLSEEPLLANMPPGIKPDDALSLAATAKQTGSQELQQQAHVASPLQEPTQNGGSGRSNTDEGSLADVALDTRVPPPLAPVGVRPPPVATPLSLPGALDVLTALQGEGHVAVETLHSDALQARKQFGLLLSTPGVEKVIADVPDASSVWNDLKRLHSRRRRNGTQGAGEGLDIAIDPKGPTIPSVALLTTVILRASVPQILAAGTSDKQQLLASFSERYDSLLSRYEALQQRCREMSSRQDDADSLAQQAEMWKSAHVAATERIEQLSGENAELKDLLHAARPEDPKERWELEQRLSQRDAELVAASASLRQLQEVLDEGHGELKARCARLEKDLVASDLRACDAERTLKASDAAARAAAEVTNKAEVRRAEADERCRNVEDDAGETQRALEQLLHEKGRFMEEREHLIDRRLVASMIANYLDHLASGQSGLAEQVIQQTLQVMGGTPDMAYRAKLRSESDKITEGPLLDSFAEWLDRETAD